MVLLSRRDGGCLGTSSHFPGALLTAMLESALPPRQDADGSFAKCRCETSHKIASRRGGH